MPRFSWPVLAVSLAMGAATAQDLTIVTWGGAYEAAQQRAVFAPFTEATGTEIEIVQYDGTTEALVRRAAQEGWDVVDMLHDQALAACRAGILAEIDFEALLGREALSDFAPLGPARCMLPQNVYARVIAYDDRAFPGVKPARIEDFFDTEQFPGKRAVQMGPDGILEWALMAEGVPPAQVYDLLSTDRGLRLAFRRLETIREDIVWWSDAAEPSAMLRDGRAAMAGGFNGRFFAAAEGEGAPISIVWDGRLIGTEVWSILAGTDAPDKARAFLAHAARPEAMARLAERIPYGPARLSGLDRIGLNPVTASPMRVHLPNASHQGARALVRDSRWYAGTEGLRERRFRDWLARGEGSP